MKKSHVWGMAIALILLGIGTFRFIDSVAAGNWDEKQKAVETAYRQTMMAKADKVEPFVGDQPYNIVFGEDKIGKKMIAWISETDIHGEYASDGVTEQSVRDKLIKSKPGADIIRITPGKYGNEYCWEVYYTLSKSGKVGHYYQYYRFSDGEPLDTYNLNLAD